MHPEYKIIMGRDEFFTLHETMVRVEHYESYLHDRNIFRPPSPPSSTLVVVTIYQLRKRSELAVGKAAVIRHVEPSVEIREPVIPNKVLPTASIKCPTEIDEKLYGRGKSRQGMGAESEGLGRPWARNRSWGD